MIAFYAFFNTLRRKGIAQKELLENKVISNGTLQRMRQNDTVGSDTLNRICEYLDCSVSEVCEYVPDEPVSK